jgi:hypothetical protein
VTLRVRRRVIHYNPPMTPKVTGLIPMAFVADVQRSIDFYALLNLKVRNTFKNDTGQLLWAHVECEQAELMFSLASDPVITRRKQCFSICTRPTAARESAP